MNWHLVGPFLHVEEVSCSWLLRYWGKYGVSSRRVGNSTYASAWTAVQIFFSNWSPIEAYYTVLQYDSSVLYVLMSSDPIRRFVLQFNHQISPLASNCFDILYHDFKNSKASRGLEHPYTVYVVRGL